MIDFTKIKGFDWDKGIVRKNDKQSVSTAEAEQVFFNDPLLLIDGTKHSQGECGFHALVKTNEERTLHITLILPNAGERIRVIS
jgi:uncharacterized DUF497 family protein